MHYEYILILILKIDYVSYVTSAEFMKMGT